MSDTLNTALRDLSTQSSLRAAADKTSFISKLGSLLRERGVDMADQAVEAEVERAVRQQTARTERFRSLDEGQLLSVAGGGSPVLSSCSYVRSTNCGSCCSRSTVKTIVQ